MADPQDARIIILDDPLHFSGLGLAGPSTVTPSASPHTIAPPSSTTAQRRALKDQRLQELLERCREEALQQLIGPFGLTPAMFNDIDGGNVTTQHNAEQDIYAKESERYDRDDYDYEAAKRKKKKEAVESGAMNSQEFTDSYTGEKAPTQRTTESGKQVMNAELDHTVPLKQAHKEGGWMLDPKRRKELASEPDNLHYTTFENNRSKSDNPAEQALSAENGYDESRTQPIIDKARKSIDEHLPTTGERLKYHGHELGITGAKEFAKTGMRRAIGLLLFELLNGAFLETRQVLTQRDSTEPLLDRLGSAIKRLLARLQHKFKDVFAEFFRGGIQGFVSNLLTFLINNLITTSAKVVTIIREGLHKLWDALKMLLWPPAGMSSDDRLRAIVKSFAGLFTLGAGMLWEQSVNTFLLSIPPLAPFAGIVSPVVTGLLTGLATALLMYALDSLLDWMLDKGTACLNAQLDTLDGYQELIQRTGEQIEAQFRLAESYRAMSESQQHTATDFEAADDALYRANRHAEATRDEQAATVAVLTAAADARQALKDRLDVLLTRASKEA